MTRDPVKAISIDIETLGRTPNSVILSIGAVEVNFELGHVGKGLHVNMDPEEVEFYGMIREPETVRWWNNQSAVARKRTFDPTTRIPLKHALQQLTDFIYGYCGKGRTYEIYVCGPDFDIAMLSNSYRAVGLEVPWPFWCVRDYRTLREWFPDVPTPVKNTGAHDALNDAIYQAHHLIAIHKHVFGKTKIQQTVDNSTDDEL